MRTLGEPTRSRRLTDEPNTVELSEQTVEPPSARRLQPPGDRRPSDDGAEDAADERTSPFPYAENFDEWVADEDAATDGRRRRRTSDSA